MAGQSASLSQGATGLVVTVLLVGAAFAAAAGSVGAPGSRGLTGQAVTTAQGTASPSQGGNAVLSGITLNSGQGSLDTRSHGQEATFSQGTLTPSSSVAQTSSLISGSQGTANPNNDGTVPISGSEVVTASGSVGTGGQSAALTGSESTSGIGTVVYSLRPTDISGQSITTESGTVQPSGNSVTVNITGIDFTAIAGDVNSGSQVISGEVGTSASGTVTYGLSLPIDGIGITSDIGQLSPNQDAVDSLITSSSGLAVSAFDVALNGVELASAQGTVGITGDAEIALTGQELTSAQETITDTVSCGLAGQGISAAQNNMGAPGGASLTGAESTLAQGDVFLTNDRTFALSGLGMTAQDGAALASSLAFPSGQGMTLAIEGIGPRTVEMLGMAVTVSAGEIHVERVKHTTPGTHKRGKNYTIRGKRYFGITNEELAKLLAQELVDISREDIQVTYKNKKPHKVSKAVFEEAVDTASKLPKPESTDDQDIEDILALL